MASSFIPEAIVTDIISNLSVKSLLRFKSVSKTWYSLISSPDFINLHLHQSIQYSYTHQQLLVLDIDALYSKRGEPYIYDPISGKQVEIETPFRNFKQYTCSVVCSCDGLLMLRVSYVTETHIAMNTETISFIIWNPSIKECQVLDKPIDEDNNGTLHMWFGYDSSTDDYKVIRHNIKDFKILSLKSNSWRDVKDFKNANIVNYGLYMTGPHVNGAIHWISKRTEEHSSEKIVAFNLAEEKFMDLAFPDDMISLYRSFYYLTSFQGCLCLSELTCTPYQVLPKSFFTVWLNREYGVSSNSWTKFITIPNIVRECPVVIPKPVCLFKNSVLLIRQEPYADEDFLLYDLKEKKLKSTEISKNRIYKAFTFVESLVSPKSKLNGKYTN